MDSFAFIIHPIDPKRDVARKYPLLGKLLPEAAIHFFSGFWPPVYLSHITGARSRATGKEIEGWLIAVPYTVERMLKLPPREVYRKIVAAGHLAEDLGAKILGLGAYTSIVGDGGFTVAERLEIPVTSGDSYTASVAVKATRKGAALMGVDFGTATVAVVGATGAIGGIVARQLASGVGQMMLIGRNREALEERGAEIRAESGAEVTLSLDVQDIRRAQVIVTVTSAGGNLVRPEYLQRGAVVCDVSRPRDVSWQVAQARKDVLVFDGGLLEVPGDVDFGFDYGPPPNMTFGCIAETMTLAFEGQFEDYSLGKNLDIDMVEKIDAQATKHGFRLAALRSFEHKLEEARIEQVRAYAAVGGRV
ncbi:MAG: shikimate dehydrogenase [Anaerolineae bacterium]